MIFGFSLCAALLLVVLVAYFRIELGNLVGGKPPENGKVCHCQHQKWVLVLVDFQNKLVQYKPPDYILDIIPRTAI